MSSDFSVQDCVSLPEPQAALPAVADLGIPAIENAGPVPFVADLPQIIGVAPPLEAWIAFVVLGLWLCFGRPRVMALVLMGLMLVPTGFWLTLKVADGLRQEHRHLEAAKVLERADGFLPTVFWIQRWRDNKPVDLLLEANSTEGIWELLARGDLEAALELTTGPEPVTVEGQIARAGAFQEQARDHLVNERFGLALRYAEKAFGAITSAPTQEGLRISQVHLAISQLAKGNLGGSRSQLDQIEAGWRPELFAELLTALVHEEVRSLLSESPDQIHSAASRLSKSWERLGQIDQRPKALACYYSGALNLQAASFVEAKRGSSAVSALRQAESLVADRDGTKHLFPEALRLQGLEEIASLEGEAATQTLEEAFVRSEQPTSELLKNLTTAWLLHGRQQLEVEHYDSAVDAMIQAHQHSGGTRQTAQALDEARLERADEALKVSQWPRAKQDLVAVRSRGHLAAAAAMRLAYLDGAEHRVKRIRNVPSWAPVPQPTGEIPHDRDGDGQADALVYFGPEGPIGFRELTAPERVFFTTAPDNIVSSSIADLDGDGHIDEYVKFENGYRRALIDIDRDARPDIKLAFADEDGTLVSQEALSGEVLMRIGCGLIGKTVDPFWAGEADAFIVVSVNGEVVLRTRSVPNSQHPCWHEGVTVHARAGDQIRLDLWDLDWKYHDHIDTYVYSKLPTSGRFNMAKGHAAIHLNVTPSELPHGYSVAFTPSDPDYNAFRDDPNVRADFSELAAQAERVEANAEIMGSVWRMVASELLVMALIPRASLVTQLAAGLAFEELVLTPLVH